MKRSHALVLASTLAVSAAFAANASASNPRPAADTAGPKASIISLGEGDDAGTLAGGRSAHGSIGKTAPSANAANRIRALGGDGNSGSDDGGALPRGRSAHGSIGKTAPKANAANRIRALGGDDNSGSDDGGALPRGRSAHGSIGKTAPKANAASRIRALGGDD